MQSDGDDIQPAVGQPLDLANVSGGADVVGQSYLAEGRRIPVPATR